MSGQRHQVCTQATRFDSLVIALTKFKELEGHFVVPLAFEIPTRGANWPQETRGMKLGRELDALIRYLPHASNYLLHSRRSIGFPVDNWKEYILHTTTIPAFVTYQRLYNSMSIPRGFVVPYGDWRWPRPTWRYPLGSLCVRLRQNREKMHRDEIQAFDQIGLEWCDRNPSVNEQRELVQARAEEETRNGEKDCEALVLALTKFNQREDHFAVPFDFEIPMDDPFWPTMLGGMKLGAQLHWLMQNLVQTSTTRQMRLGSIGFPVHDWRSYVWKTTTVPALVTYKALHGDLLVPLHFEVPCGNATWPRTTWKNSLGPHVLELRGGNMSDEEAQALHVTGCAFEVTQSKWDHRLLPALLLFCAKYDTMDVPTRFAIGQDDDFWPKELRGLQLGHIVHHILNGGYASVPDMAARLKALFSSPTIRDGGWSTMILPALQVSHSLHGHCDVPSDFITPNEPP